MNILYVINSFTRAGAEILVFNLAKGLRQRKHNIVIAALYRKNDVFEQELISELNGIGIKTYILDKKVGKNRISTVLRTWRIVRDEKTEVLHAHCSVPMLVGKMVGFVSKTPVVCTVHSTKGYSAFREKTTGWLAAAYVAIGTCVEKYMIDKLGIPRNKITRIYNAVDTKLYAKKTKTANFWEAFGLDSSKPVIIAVGRIVELKNHMCLLQAVQRCASLGENVQAAVLGEYDENSGCYRKLHEYLEENNLQEQVKFLGCRNDVYRFLANTDCYVLTSRYEGLSISFLEALFCCCPIISVDLPFVREINEIALCATVIPQNDFSALADIIISNKFYPASQKARNTLKAFFSQNKMIENHEELYRANIRK